MKRIIIRFMCLVLGAVCLTGCANNEAFTKKSYIAEGKQITEICVDVWDRQIEVMLSPDNQVHIDYFESSKEYYDISASDNHTLTMFVASDKEWTDYIGGKSTVSSRKILLQVPDTFLTTLTLSTTNEDISLSALSGISDISLSAQGGNIMFNKLHVDKSIHLNAKNGDITGSIIGSYDDYVISSNHKKGKAIYRLTKVVGQRY